MTRKKSKVAKAAVAKAAAGVAAKADQGSPPQSKEITESVYGKKKIFALFIQSVGPNSWTEINPHCSDDENSEGCPFALNRMQEINSPPTHLDVHKFRSCGKVVFNSKVYFIGGQYRDEFLDNNELLDSNGRIIGNKTYSDKIFTYHLVSHKWEELPCKLNIARSRPIVLVVGNVIYVIDGMIDSATRHITNKEHWMECFNALDVEKKKTCDFLPASSVPPDDVFRYVPAYKFAYEPRNELVFVMPEGIGGYSFNCVSKTWTSFHENISKQACFMCNRVAVVDHHIFLYYEGFIYAYDLNNNQLVLSQCLPSSFGGANGPENSCEFDTYSLYLERVGKSTLVLIHWHYDRSTGKTVHLYKFQIKFDENLRLLPVGQGHYYPPGNFPIDVVTG